MQKVEALKIVLNCAIQFENNLKNKNVLFLYEKDRKIYYIETAFFSRNFLHLTGLRIANKYTISATEFYSMCLRKKLSIEHFELSTDGTTRQKLQVLPQVMNIHRNAKMIGYYNGKHPRLSTDIITGTIFSCLGFKEDKKFYVPNTVLKEDIRDVCICPIYKVIGIFTKRVRDERYNRISYMNKRYNLNMITLNENLRSLLENGVISEVGNGSRHTREGT